MERVAAISPLPAVAIFTGGGDKPYALGLALGLAAEGITMDFIGSDFLAAPEILNNPSIRFLNLRGDVRAEVPIHRKIGRVARYYWRLVRYAVGAKPPIFHILWNNKVELVDRTVLMLLYRALGKRVVLTVHNVNVRQRDGNDSIVNRWTLGVQYRLADHLFVHTERMREQLCGEFGISGDKVSVIPFGINATVAATELSYDAARQRLGLARSDKVLVFFGNIAPYKGLHVLVDALARIAAALPECKLIIAGRPKGEENYWGAIEKRIVDLDLADKVTRRIEYVPDDETEVLFKAADLLVLPYTHVFQSGVLFLGYNFGLPVVATDVGSLKDDVADGETGFVCAPDDPQALADAIGRYFASDLYRSMPACRSRIRQWALDRNSWAKVAALTVATYRALRMGG